MRKLRPSQIDNLKKSGVEIEGAGFMPSPNKKPITPPTQTVPYVPPPPTPTPISVQVEIPDMSNIAKQLIDMSGRITGVLEELAKPKDKRKFEVIVGRDVGGRVNKMSVEEM